MSFLRGNSVLISFDTLSFMLTRSYCTNDCMPTIKRRLDPIGRDEPIVGMAYLFGSEFTSVSILLTSKGNHQTIGIHLIGLGTTLW